jgi:hypothetical protein
MRKAMAIGLTLLFVLPFLGGCGTARNYECSDVAPDRTAQLAITTDTLSKSRWYLLSSYHLQFSVFRPSQGQRDKPLYMGRIILSADVPRQVITIPAGEPIFVSALYQSQTVNTMSMCRPSTKVLAEPGGFYELLFHNENNLCTLEVISSGDNETRERSEMKKP